MYISNICFCSLVIFTILFFFFFLILNLTSLQVNAVNSDTCIFENSNMAGSDIWLNVIVYRDNVIWLNVTHVRTVLFHRDIANEESLVAQSSMEGLIEELGISPLPDASPTEVSWYSVLDNLQLIICKQSHIYYRHSNPNPTPKSVRFCQDSFYCKIL